MAELTRAIGEKLKRERRRDASLYAILCNLLASGSRRWTAEDFEADGDGEEIDPAAAQAALADYQREQARAKEDWGRERSVAK